MEAYDLRSLQRQRVVALLEMMRRAVDVDGQGGLGMNGARTQDRVANKYGQDKTRQKC